MADHQERFKLARDNFAKAVTRLQEALAAYEDDFVRGSIIRRFTFAYELGWKRCSTGCATKVTVPEAGQPVLQAAFKTELIEDAKLWEQIKDFTVRPATTTIRKKPNWSPRSSAITQPADSKNYATSCCLSKS